MKRVVYFYVKNTSTVLIAMEPVDDSLIDRIYEAVFIPELWSGVLGDMAKIATASTAYLFVSKGEIHRWAGMTPASTEALRPLVESGWIAGCERFRRLRAVRQTGFCTEADVYPSGGTEDDASYRDILYPRGLGHAAAMSVALPMGDNFTIALERQLMLGPVEPAAIRQLNVLSSHLGRGAVLTARLELERAQAMSQALALVGLSTLVFDADGRVIAANDLMVGMHGLVTWRAHGRVALNDQSADKLLQRAITSIDRGDAKTVRSFPIRDGDQSPAMIAHLLPIRRSARDIFSRCTGVLVMTPVAPQNALPVGLVNLLFDLTPAESRVAHELATGRSTDAIALHGGVSINTVRTQVRSILEKTGCKRRVDLVALLSRIAAIRPEAGAPYQV